ncbi:hypothetical protein HDV03_001695, partial [Kappamyces sp. JEL0829]
SVVSVQRDYQLVFDSHNTKPVNCKVYRVGCNEKTHGLSDTLLSNLAFRGDVIVESLFGPPKDDTESRELQPSGTLLFQKYFEGTKSCLSIHVASIALHLSHFHDWMNNERVNEFWKEAGTIEQHQRYLEAQLDSKHSLPLIASYDGEPFAYFEMYYADLDKIGEYYDCKKYDRGLHFLVGNDNYRGPHRVAEWLPSLVELAFSDNPKTMRVVSEPRSDNQKMIAYLTGVGFMRLGNVQFPHKEATMMLLQRDQF